MSLLDRHQRPLRNLRLSVIDRCNLRCNYCMPEEDYDWFPYGEILRFGQMASIVDAFILLGVDKVRLTGGEPLLRRELERLVAMLAAREGIKDLALTTNGILLEGKIEALRDAGLGRITVSLDTLDRGRFEALTRRDELDRVLAGIRAVERAGMTRGFKLDTVLMRGVNDDEMVPLLDFAEEASAELRFIEYMDVGGATTWSADKVVSRWEMLERLRARFGAIEALVENDSAPADRYRLPDGRVFGIISSTTQPFCGGCDRSRLTADGRWFLCLYAHEGIDLKTPFRAGASVEELAAIIRSGWEARADRGAEQRLALADTRRALADQEALKKNPHLQMHRRGG
ncbi:MAG: GTP 3',8-cyclase MoaA [Planctomycetes bacterium]|nr:GTP 3',8-cyclase MoaA [Planctomycetota bacterium]